MPHPTPSTPPPSSLPTPPPTLLHNRHPLSPPPPPRLLHLLLLASICFDVLASASLDAHCMRVTTYILSQSSNPEIQQPTEIRMKKKVFYNIEQLILLFDGIWIVLTVKRFCADGRWETWIMGFAPTGFKDLREIAVRMIEWLILCSI